MIGGLQGIVDHVMVGHYVGFTGNAAIGVGWQIFLVVIVFISSLFTGMGVLVARVRRRERSRQGQPRRLPGVPDRVRARRSASSRRSGISPLPGSSSSSTRRRRCGAEALPYLRTMFVCSIGQLLYFMSPARCARRVTRGRGCASVSACGLNVGLNMILIRGVGPIPAFGAQGAALGTAIAAARLGGRALADGDGTRGRSTSGVPRRPDWGSSAALPLRPAGRACRAWR